MSHDDTAATIGNEDDLSPTEIAEHAFFSRQEKLDRLNQLKAIATGVVENEKGYGFTPEEIDIAIAEVKAGAAEDGDGLTPVVSPAAAMR